jgi:hypothetical protein
VRFLARVLRAFVALSVLFASLPVNATEVVCIVGPHEVTTPMAKCGMPCCAHGVMAMCDSSKVSKGAVPPCCADKQLTAKLQRQHSTCSVSGMSCRCERRSVSAVAPLTVSVRATLRINVHQLFVAILPEDLEIRVPLDASIEPGIFGVDSGPPRQEQRSPEQGRAPPSP